MLTFPDNNRLLIIFYFLLSKDSNIEHELYVQHASFPIQGTDLYEETLRLTKIFPTGNLYILII